MACLSASTTALLYYNKDLLKRAGYTDARGEGRPPKSWEELEEMAVKLTEKGDNGRPSRMGFVPNFGNTLSLHVRLDERRRVYERRRQDLHPERPQDRPGPRVDDRGL